MTPLQPEFFDVYRAGLKGAVDWMKASLENAERVQNQQLIAIRRALDGYAKTAAEIGEARSVDELLAVHARISGAQLERAMAYWTSVFETNIATFAHMQSQFQQTMSNMRQAEAAMRAAVSSARRETTGAR
jgi:hypothetical protein